MQDTSNEGETGVESASCKVPCFIGKEGKSNWRKYLTPKRNVRIRAQNIATQPPWSQMNCWSA